jgi:hypothetical protein
LLSKQSGNFVFAGGSLQGRSERKHSLSQVLPGTGRGPEKSNFYIFDFLGEEDEEEMINYMNIKGKIV